MLLLFLISIIKLCFSYRFFICIDTWTRNWILLFLWYVVEPPSYLFHLFIFIYLFHLFIFFYLFHAYFDISYCCLTLLSFLCKLLLFPNFVKHKSVICCSMPQLTYLHYPYRNENIRGGGFKVLHSWMYPQSTLPPSIISVLSSSTAEGGCLASRFWLILFIAYSVIFLLNFLMFIFPFYQIELEFLRKRQVAWEESFRDLYYMLRKNVCGLFYGIVHVHHFLSRWSYTDYRNLLIPCLLSSTFSLFSVVGV